MTRNSAHDGARRNREPNQIAPPPVHAAPPPHLEAYLLEAVAATPTTALVRRCCAGQVAMTGRAKEGMPIGGRRSTLLWLCCACAAARAQQVGKPPDPLAVATWRNSGHENEMHDESEIKPEVKPPMPHRAHCPARRTLSL